jgi:SOS-response transcriptional repressor LexA
MAKKYLQLGSTLKRLLFEKNMKPIDLARELDLPQPTIHRLVTGKSTRPYKSSLEPIANYFNISVDQLVGDEPLLADWQPEPVHDNQALQKIVIKPIPLLPWAAISNLAMARKQAKKQLAITGNVGDECFAILMNEHSMEPLFTRGTILIFDPQKKAVDRSYVLVKLANKEQFIFRQLLVDVDQSYLKPLNPDTAIYKMRLLNTDDTIIATLFESRTNFDTDDENLLLENNHGI